MNTVFKGAANLWRGVEAVGGKLTLSDTALFFKPHAINIQKDELTVAVSEIEAVAGFKNKIFGVPLLNKGLEVKTRSGQSYRFVVNKRDKWIEAIQKVIG
ncbi:hypothetical protein J9303_03515 [Bacillaceae bacterium Marseille-Q3522]|nr:hypothetical protein [Bacillaceae bacterium Marseille-Q3522]